MMAEEAHAEPLLRASGWFLQARRSLEEVARIGKFLEMETGKIKKIIEMLSRCCRSYVKIRIDIPLT